MTKEQQNEKLGKLQELCDSLSEVSLKDPYTLLREVYSNLDSNVSLASSFSLEDVILIDMLFELGLNPRVFALDTGRLNEETYFVAESIASKYSLKIEWYFPEKTNVEKLIRDKGLYSFKESIQNRKECCAIRKVEPLGRALKGLSGWLTGQRKEQSATRAELREVEVDSVHGILKCNPLASWSLERVKAYVEEKKIPYNALYKQGYTSIGCAPCTRAVAQGEDERAGRWWWESPEHKECGLHFNEETP